jgi:4'-phosphopantetheinyl transferase superfamily
VRLPDARLADLDLFGLRARARAEAAATGAAHVARSYSYPFALVAWHDGRVGVDLERIEPCDDAFARFACTPSELGDLAHTLERDLYVTTLWCSKEALAKALGDAVNYDPSRLEAPSRWPGGQSGPWYAQSLWVAAQHTAWLCWESTVDSSEQNPPTAEDVRHARLPMSVSRRYVSRLPPPLRQRQSGRVSPGAAATSYEVGKGWPTSVLPARPSMKSCSSPCPTFGQLWALRAPARSTPAPW